MSSTLSYEIKNSNRSIIKSFEIKNWPLFKIEVSVRPFALLMVLFALQFTDTKVR